MKSLKMLIFFEIGLILVHFDALKQKLSCRKRFKRFSIDMLLNDEYSKYLRFRRLKNLKELNEILK